MSGLRQAAQAALQVLMTEAHGGVAADKVEAILLAALAEPVCNPDLKEVIDGLAECQRLIGTKEAMRGVGLAYTREDAIIEGSLRESAYQHRQTLLAALAEQQDAKPTAWCWATEGVRGMVFHGPGPDADIAARAAAAETPRTVQYLWDGPPPRREWVGLTDDEREEFAQWVHPDVLDSIEAARKERNA